MWFIGAEVEQETSAPPPKKNPGSSPEYTRSDLSLQRLASPCCCNYSPDLYTRSDLSPRRVAATCRLVCTDLKIHERKTINLVTSFFIKPNRQTFVINHEQHSLWCPEMLPIHFTGSRFYTPHSTRWVRPLFTHYHLFHHCTVHWKKLLHAP